MYPAMYSGTVPGAELVGMVLATALAMLSVPIVALWWWKHPPRNPAVPAAAYLIVALACAWGWPNDTVVAPLEVGFGLLMPWSLLYFLATGLLEAEIGQAHAVVAALLNAALIYGAAALFRGRR